MYTDVDWAQEQDLHRGLPGWTLLAVPLTFIVLVPLALACGALLQMQAGLWGLPAILPAAAWVACSIARGRLALPDALARIRGRRRGILAVAIWAAMRLLWPVWAGPAEAAWRAGNAGVSFQHGVNLPYGAVVATAPATLGVICCLVLAFLMVIAPRKAPRGFRPAPASERLRSPLSDPDDEEWETRL